MLVALTATQIVTRLEVPWRAYGKGNASSCCQSSTGVCPFGPHVMSGLCHGRWGADYLLKTLVYDTTNANNLTGLIYQVGNLTTDSLFWGRPEDITMKRPYYVASSDSMSDLGGPSPSKHVHCLQQCHLHPLRILLHLFALLFLWPWRPCHLCRLEQRGKAHTRCYSNSGSWSGAIVCGKR